MSVLGDQFQRDVCGLRVLPLIPLIFNWGNSSLCIWCWQFCLMLLFNVLHLIECMFDTYPWMLVQDTMSLPVPRFKTSPSDVPDLCRYFQMDMITCCVKRLLLWYFGKDHINPLPRYTISQLLVCGMQDICQFQREWEIYKGFFAWRK